MRDIPSQPWHVAAIQHCRSPHILALNTDAHVKSLTYRETVSSQPCKAGEGGKGRRDKDKLPSFLCAYTNLHVVHITSLL